jgi:hypothetical protein
MGLLNRFRKIVKNISGTVKRQMTFGKVLGKCEEKKALRSEAI